MQVSSSSVARPWELEQNTSGQASRQASRQASAMEIASRLWKLENKALFWSSKRRKSGRAKIQQCDKEGPCFGPQKQVESGAFLEVRF